MLMRSFVGYECTDMQEPKISGGLMQYETLFKIIDLKFMYTLEDLNITMPLKLPKIEQTNCIPLLALDKIMVVH